MAMTNHSSAFRWSISLMAWNGTAWMRRRIDMNYDLAVAKLSGAQGESAGGWRSPRRCAFAGRLSSSARSWSAVAPPLWWR